jgi:hypothetical protein
MSAQCPVCRKSGHGWAIYEYVTQALSALSVNYSAGRAIAAESEPSRGTKLDIAATDQVRPIATTTAIPTINARICIPSTLSLPIGFAYFFAAPM